jgi:methionyl-tRNA formyltransferase
MSTPLTILYLGPEREAMRSCIEGSGDRVIQTTENLKARPDLLATADFIVSWGYRHIIRPDVVRQFHRRIINLHISLLPWNRGADPNVWSFLEETPKGVSIHYVDEGIDTGDILCQKEVSISSEETLRTSYDKLSLSIEALFQSNWSTIRNGDLKGRPQSVGGTYHRMKDLDPYRHLLTNGWETPVAQLTGQARSSAGRIARVG